MLKRLRVHIAPVGFEVDRVVIPLEEFKADRVWLISEKNKAIDKAMPYLNRIKEKLKRKKIEFKDKECDIRNLFDVLRTYKEIIEEEGKDSNLLFFNVSTGSKIESMAGMMACMMFRSNKLDIQAYYVEPKRYVTKLKKEEELSMGCEKIIRLPNYRIEKPEEKLIDALSIIDMHSDGISKKMLIDAAERKSLFTIKENATSKAAARHSALNNGIIEPLKKWGFIELIGKGKRGKVVITPEGKNALYFLGK